VCCIGAGIGGGFTNTNELHVMKYNEAMATKDVEQWHDAVGDEYKRMKMHKVFDEVPMDEVPEDTTILTLTWAMKKKANGTFRARLNARGFEQVDREHFDSDDKAAPVVSEITIWIILTMIIMAAWCTELMGVRGAFLHGDFDPKHKMYMYMPQGFEA
jgi:hypothetical protein